MQILSEKEIVRRIRKQEPFNATLENGCFAIKVDRYVPVVCTAIHAGHRLSDRVAGKMLLDEAERRYEEDPYTGDMLASFSLVLKGLDSRFMYDLNRSADECIYETAWGKQVWRLPLTEKEREGIVELHNSYYRILDVLLSTLVQKYNHCVVYDLHSYNYKRLESGAPLFNIGTHYIDQQTYAPVLDNLKKWLSKAQLPNIENRLGLNEVFFGRGYQASFIHQHHCRCLCIPLEIKKVYMDEATGEPYPLVLEIMAQALKEAVSYNAAYFTRKYAKKRMRRSVFFAEESDRMIKKVDAALYRVAKGIDSLRYINPVNLAQERKQFFAKHCNYTPQFHYRQLKIEPFLFRKKLYAIPVDDIGDVSIRQLYRSTVDMLARKIDMLTCIGTSHFLYNSLRFHGEPRKADIELARFLIAAPPIEDEEERTLLSTEACIQAFQEAIDAYGFTCRVESTSRIVARAMINNSRRTILINRRARFTATEIQALIQHELGVHMVTTVNADQTTLKVFKLGLPGNTQTQEGLALLSEYLSGNLTISRLKSLAHRVMAVHMMIQNYDFSRTYETLTSEFGLSPEDAFSLAVRVYRGGGFTKDYLYLNGLRKALRMYRSGIDMRPLFVGKTSMFYLETIKEMIDRAILTRPAFIPHSWGKKETANPVLDYVLKAVN